MTVPVPGPGNAHERCSWLQKDREENLKNTDIKKIHQVIKPVLIKQL